MSTHLGDVEVRELTRDALRGADIVFFAAGAATSRRHAPAVADVGRRRGRQVERVPHGSRRSAGGPRGQRGDARAAPRHRRQPQLRRDPADHRARAAAARVRAASRHRRHVPGRHRRGHRPRRRACRRRRATTPPARHPSASVYPHVLHGNVVPGGWAMQGDDTEEEIKVIAETRRVLDAPGPAHERHDGSRAGGDRAQRRGVGRARRRRRCRRRARAAARIARDRGRRRSRHPALSHAASRRGQRRRAGGSHPPRPRDARTASRCSSAPTTFARVRRPMPSRSRSCCSASAERLTRESPGHAPRGALNSANGGDDRRGPRAPRAGSRVHGVPAAPHPHPGRSRVRAGDRARHGGRRGPGRERGPRRQTLCRCRRPPADEPARIGRARSTRHLHHQHREVPSAAQSRSRAARGRGVQPLPRRADRARSSPT